MRTWGMRAKGRTPAELRLTHISRFLHASRRYHRRYQGFDIESSAS